MMFLLIGNVGLDGPSRRGADCECCVSFLPGKRPTVEIVVNPTRRCLFQLAHHVGQTMARFQANQEVYMIDHSSHTLRESVQTRNRTAKILMESASPRRDDPRFPRFRAEDEMIMEAAIGGRHGRKLLLRPLWGRSRLLRIVTGGIAALNPRPMAMNPSGSDRRTDITYLRCHKRGVLRPFLRVSRNPRPLQCPHNVRKPKGAHKIITREGCRWSTGIGNGSPGLSRLARSTVISILLEYLTPSNS